MADPDSKMCSKEFLGRFTFETYCTTQGNTRKNCFSMLHNNGRRAFSWKTASQETRAPTTASNEDENENEEVFYCVLTYFSTAADIIPW